MPPLMTNEQTPSEALFRYTGGEFERAQEHRADGLLVADSFLVDGGKMLARDVHRDRFAQGVVRQGGSRAAATTFWDAAASAIPPVEQWFPRIELVNRDAAPEFRLRVRPAPPRGDSVRVRSFAGPDPRTLPEVKGPDISVLSALRQDSDADEVVLLNLSGHVIEGTTSAVLWWRGSTLYRVPSDLARVPSVTERVITVLATALGVPVVEESVGPASLADAEVWLVNALHGIRYAVAWDDDRDLRVDRTRLTAWRKRLTALAQPLGESPTLNH